MAVDKSRYAQMKRKTARRKPASFPSDIVGGIARNNSAAAEGSYEQARMNAKVWDRTRKTDSLSGKFTRKADRIQDKTIARQIRKNSSVRGNDYQYGTKEQVQAQHNSRYRNIRRAFGMSAG